MTPEIISRLKIKSSSLSGRVYGAAALAALMKDNQVPKVTPCAHVLPTGLTGRKPADAATGAFVQSYDYGFAVVLSLRAHDALGERLVLDEVLPQIVEIAKALVGWTPDPDTAGVFEFRQARLASFARGVAIYELTFALQDQLRIIP
ncbi:hypothetical protein JI664_22375 [Rhodobacter sp. NTK016B]|uniref:phage tail terminator protein n=1 Tax=Rhodobacter sp. NTK016B TaxID=2759676 RepID=UPI001A8C1959|nr:hypothetical protein [Rhodobacter sp. NTK016B]MBN8294733.1 hypothetical protein [Rhodobacter sp. NTK016B]